MLTSNQQEISLGDLKFGVPYDFKYTITNTYDSPVKIDRLILGCNSCTKASAQRSILTENESTDVNVTFTPGSTGIQSKVIYVQHSTDNKRRPDLVLKFKANVK